MRAAQNSCSSARAWSMSSWPASTRAFARAPRLFRRCHSSGLIPAVRQARSPASGAQKSRARSALAGSAGARASYARDRAVRVDGTQITQVGITQPLQDRAPVPQQDDVVAVDGEHRGGVVVVVVEARRWRAAGPDVVAEHHYRFTTITLSVAHMTTRAPTTKTEASKMP